MLFVQQMSQQRSDRNTIEIKSLNQKDNQGPLSTRLCYICNRERGGNRDRKRKRQSGEEIERDEEMRGIWRGEGEKKKERDGWIDMEETNIWRGREIQKDKDRCQIKEFEDIYIFSFDTIVLFASEYTYKNVKN